MNVERVHREHVAVRSIPLWRGPSAVISLAEIVSDMERAGRETAADSSAARQLGDAGRQSHEHPVPETAAAFKYLKYRR
jgi:hypothetical protein